MRPSKDKIEEWCKKAEGFHRKLLNTWKGWTKNDLRDILYEALKMPLEMWELTVLQLKDKNQTYENYKSLAIQLEKKLKDGKELFVEERIDAKFAKKKEKFRKIFKKMKRYSNSRPFRGTKGGKVFKRHWNRKKAKSSRRKGLRPRVTMTVTTLHNSTSSSSSSSSLSSSSSAPSSRASTKIACKEGGKRKYTSLTASTNLGKSEITFMGDSGASHHMVREKEQKFSISVKIQKRSA